MAVTYNRQYVAGVGWINFPSTASPINETNLNQMDNAIKNVDAEAQRAINTLELTKADSSVVDSMVDDVDLDTATGVLTVTFGDGSKKSWDTAMEKIATNWTYDHTSQQLILTMPDGTTENVDLSALITQNEFADTDTIAFLMDATTGSVSAIVRDNSITGDKLEPNYLANVTIQANNAKDYARTAQSYANGTATKDDGTDWRAGQSVDNAKYYKEKAEQAAVDAQRAAGLTPFTGATATTAGEKGLVPAPAAGEQDKFLKGDGAWADVDALPSGGTAGQVLTKKSATDGDAEWANPPDTGVTSFNTRTGAVVPESGDYTAAQVARGASDVDADLTAVEGSLSTANTNITAINGKIGTINTNINTINGKIGSTDISGVGSTITGAISNINTLYNTRHGRTRKRFYDLAKLASAAAEQNLEKYGLAIGDYYIGASGYEYTIADPDTFYGGYDSYAVLSTHHICLVVDTKQNCQWNTSDTTASGYNGSNLHSYLKGTVLNNVKSDLGTSHLLSHQKLLTTANANWAWQTGQYISALSEVQVYGSTIWSLNGYQEGECARQLEVFRKFRWNQIFGNTWFWLRNIQSSSGACCAYSGGDAGYHGASVSGRAAGLIIFH